MLASSRPNLSAEEALGDGYVMVDWGLSHGLNHRRTFPDAPEPQVRLGQAKMALSYLLAVGGAAYLPLRMIKAELDSKDLHLVRAAPPMDQTAYAVYPVRSAREPLIQSALALFEDDLVSPMGTKAKSNIA